ncbi:hypothetical protein ACFFOS_13705 [Nocardioides kongjuensis]|uniref:Mce-associated membrane protein n=1 Tax=Nocardioides kongjuensis TaxID=349522 RepID=A0A852RNK1_9ACTN|nr:hypothetical protein [Nocardioides kongjuensis]NYD32585.1 hypothetical protein [Nocardioides kongjuensis]
MRTGVVVLVAVVLLLVTGQRALAWHDERAQVTDGRDAVAAASAEVEGLIDISSATSDADMEELLAGATAGFRTELEGQADRLQQALTENAVKASGDVVSAGLVKLAGDRATVIVAAAGSVQNKQTKAAEPRNYRLTVDLQRVKGDWLVSGLEFVA